jgi:hypothetical protein
VTGRLQRVAVDLDRRHPVHRRHPRPPRHPGIRNAEDPDVGVAEQATVRDEVGGAVGVGRAVGGDQKPLGRLAPGDQHRTCGMVDHFRRDRPDEDPAHGAQPTRTDHDQVGPEAVGFDDDLGRRPALSDLDLDGHPLGLEPVRDAGEAPADVVIHALPIGRQFHADDGGPATPLRSEPIGDDAHHLDRRSGTKLESGRGGDCGHRCVGTVDGEQDPHRADLLPCHDARSRARMNVPDAPRRG